MSSRLKPTVVVVLVAVCVWLGTRLPLADWSLALVSWVRGAGWTGIMTYAACYIAATVLLLPASILTLGAGFAYGPIVGTLIVSPVSVTAATTAFLLARTVAGDWVRARVASPRLAAIDEAIARQGFYIVLLLRLSPLVPFNVLNYSLGLTRVRPLHYVVASAIGMLPATAAYVYLGSSLSSASELVAGRASHTSPVARALYWGGLVATFAVTVLITRVARRALDRSLAEHVEERALGKS